MQSHRALETREPKRESESSQRPATVRGPTEAALLLLRVVVGIIFVAHGAHKLSDPTATAAQFGEMGVLAPRMSVWLAIAGEFFGGLGLMLGLLTRLAALGPLLTMVGAILTVHLGHGLFAQNGGWEYPLTLLLVNLIFVTHGGGPYSLDALLRRWRRKAQVGVRDVHGSHATGAAFH